MSDFWGFKTERRMCISLLEAKNEMINWKKQVDAVVGQGDSTLHPSHFIALNLNGQIEVIEFPGGDATHARIYLGPHLYGAHASLVPVTLQFIDSRHDHHPDMLVLFQDELLIFHNSQGTFHAPPAILS